MTAATVRQVLADIAADVARDAREFDGRPFNGRTVAEYLGNHGAAIAALTDVITTLLPAEDEPERDPVPYVDYLPEEPFQPLGIHPAVQS